MNYKLLGYAVIIIFLQAGCVRKNPHFFVFDAKGSEKNNNPLALPMIKKITAATTDTGNLISWNALTPDVYSDHELLFLGYNLYRFTQTSFIPREPMTTEPLQKNFFIDTQAKNYPLKKYCYLVKAVFKKQNNVIEGIGSKVIVI